MLQVARLAPQLLGESADAVAAFVRGQQNSDGGFKDRAGRSDLYYTVFGLDGLLALRADLPAGAVLSYLRSFGEGDGLDLVHLGCLARCWASLPPILRNEAPAERILARVEKHRSADGGYAPSPGGDDGTIYACFVAAGAYDDLSRPMPEPLRLLDCLTRLQAEDGGYANQRDMPLGLTPSTAAAVALLRHLEQPLPPQLGDWLLARCRPEGGFYATPIAPLPDLLSTATARSSARAAWRAFTSRSIRSAEPCPRTFSDSHCGRTVAPFTAPGPTTSSIASIRTMPYWPSAT